MAVNETGHQEGAVEVDNFCGRTDEGSEACVAADVDDAAVADGERFGGRIFVIGSEDGGVAVDAIGWLVGSVGGSYDKEKVQEADS